MGGAGDVRGGGTPSQGKRVQVHHAARLLRLPALRSVRTGGIVCFRPSNREAMSYVIFLRVLLCHCRCRAILRRRQVAGSDAKLVVAAVGVVADEDEVAVAVVVGAGAAIRTRM